MIMRSLLTIIILIITMWHPRPKCDRNKEWDKLQKDLAKQGCIMIFDNKICYGKKPAKSSCDDLTIEDNVVK